MAYQIQWACCSGCHRCRVECPVGAVSFRNHKYWIDPNKCISCGHCAEVCHNDAISDPERVVTVETEAPVTLECDVLVLGGGASGLVAAARAATRGKKVIVLEKNKEVGGCGWYANVFKSYWSRWHAEAGLTDPREQILREFVEQTGGAVDPKLVQRILKANAELSNWLIDEQDLGKDFTFGEMFWGEYGLQGTYKWEYNARRIDTTIGPGGTGWYITNKMRDVVLENGGQIFCYTEATRLLTDSSGAVTGAEARRPKGELTVHAKSVVVAAGAFTHNRELMAKFQPRFYNDIDEPVHVFTCPTCTGDGITMCDALGADIDYQNARAAMFGPMRHPYGTCSVMAALYPSGVRVNANGDRFEEGVPMQPEAPLSFQPGRYCWQVMTHEAVAAAMKANMGKPDELPGVQMDRFYENWEQELEFEYPSGSVFKCDTLEGLAEKIGVPYENLRRSVDQYNEDLESGVTPKVQPLVMGGVGELRPIQEGPYYGLFMKLFHENAIGGMVVDENMSVLRGGIPIPGLYAAGDNTRGVMLGGDIGGLYIERVISALTYAVCSGYIAGQSCSDN